MVPPRLVVAGAAVAALLASNAVIAARTVDPESGLVIDVSVQPKPMGRGTVLRVELSNPGPRDLCLSLGSAPQWPLTDLEVVVLDSFGRVGRLPIEARDGATPTARRLGRGEVRSLAVPMDDAVTTWRNDVYQVVVTLRPREQPAADACRLDPRRMVAGPTVDFRVNGVSGQPDLAHYAAVWRSRDGSAARVDALRWLARNAVEAGMTRQAVMSLLGAPSQAPSDSSWVFQAASRAGGIVLHFAHDRVERVDFFET